MFYFENEAFFVKILILYMAVNSTCHSLNNINQKLSNLDAGCSELITLAKSILVKWLTKCRSSQPHEGLHSCSNSHGNAKERKIHVVNLKKPVLPSIP